MKKNAIKSLLSLFFVLPLMSCQSQEHVHTYGDIIPLSDATCLTSGVKAHYQCSTCKKYFDTAKNEVSYDSLVINAYGHIYGDFVITKNPTCNEDGSEYADCLRCGEAGRKVQAISHLGHHIVQVDATEPDCTNPGHLAYYHCVRVGCDSNYLDEAGTQKIDDLAAWLGQGGAGYIAPTGIHVYGEHPEAKYLVSEADCENAAVYKKSCTCGLTNGETFVYGSPLGHDYGNLIAKVDKTCTTDGIDARYCCSRCGAYFNVAKEKVNYDDLILPKGHEIVKDEAVAPTFASAGHIAGYTCKLCKTHYSDAAGTQIISDEDWTVAKLSYVEDLTKTLYYDLTSGAVVDSDTGLDGYSYVDENLNEVSFEGVTAGQIITAYAYKEGATNYKIYALAATGVISTADDWNQYLDATDKSLSGYYVLAADIASIATTASGTHANTTAINDLTIDGRNHTISALNVTSANGGMFGTCGAGSHYGLTIKDLTIASFTRANYGLLGYQPANGGNTDYIIFDHLSLTVGDSWKGAVICGTNCSSKVTFIDTTFDVRHEALKMFYVTGSSLNATFEGTNTFLVNTAKDSDTSRCFEILRGNLANERDGLTSKIENVVFKAE